MANVRAFDLDELVNRPGTYFNPQTEVLVIVDDSPHIDSDVLEESDHEGEWVLVSDDAPVDEHARDELLERFQVRHRPDATVDADEDVEDEEDDEPDGVEELHAD
jgi:hypothetical protein